MEISKLRARPVRWGMGLVVVAGSMLVLRSCPSRDEGAAKLAPAAAASGQQASDSSPGDGAPLLVEAVDGRAPALQPVVEDTEPSDRSSTPSGSPGSLTLRVACEDEKGTQLGGCYVEARDAAAGELWAHALTDADGGASLRIPAAAARTVLRAEIDGRASSGNRTIHLDANLLDLDADGVVHLVLYPFVSLRGTVKTESGAAVAGAAVSARVRGIVIGGASTAPAGPVLTDAEGAFTIPVDGVPCRVTVEAAHGDREAKPVSVLLPAGASQAVELVIYESEYEISGTVRAPEGCDVAGALVVLRPVNPPGSTLTCQATPEGTFAFVLKEPGEHRLAARSPTCSSSVPVGATTDPMRRKVSVDLPLERTSHVSGRIVQPSGEPWPGIPVGGHPTSSDADDSWLLENPFMALAQIELTHTDPQGAFRLEGLHEGYLYDLICVPDPSRPECWVRESSVRPGTTDMLIVIDEARIRGGVLAGTAVRGAEREPVHELSFWVKERHPEHAWSGRPEMKPSISDGAFRLEGLVIGNEYFMQARTRDAAPLSVGPWTATAEEQRVDLVFGMDGELKARARYTDGEPARDWIVSLVECGDGPRDPIRLPPRGPEGVVRFLPIAAGRYRASAQRGDRVVGPFDVEILAGRMTELSIDVGGE